MLYTIGTQRLKLSVLRAAVEALKITKILDWRHGAEEVKKLPPESLPALFGEAYKQVRNRELTEPVLDKLAALKSTTLLIFFDESPDGPRHADLAVPLLAKGAKVTHIFGDELIEAGEFQRSIDDEDDYTCKTWREEPKGAVKAEPVEPVSIELQRKVEAVRENSWCLSLSFGSFGNRRKVQNGALEIESEDLSVSKKLLDSPELEELDSFDNKTRSYVLARSTQSLLLKDGFYQVAELQAEEMEQYLRRRFQDRKPLIEAVRIAYPHRVKEAETRLKLKVGGKEKDVFNARDYMTVDELVSRLTMEWEWLEVSTPNKMKQRSGAWFEQERAKAARRAADAAVLIEQVLITETMGLADHMVEILTEKSVTGKRKQIQENKADRVREALDLLQSRNITNSAQLAAQVKRMRDAMEGVSTEDLKTNEQLRQHIASRFAGVKQTLSGLVQDAPSRKYRFNTEDSAA